MNAVLIISHGSRSAKTKEELTVLVNRLKLKIDVPIIEFGFLELETPSIPEGIDICVQQGATRVKVILNFLNSGRHVDQDIPEIIAEAQKKFPNVKITLSQPVGQHPSIDELFIDLINSTKDA